MGTVRVNVSLPEDLVKELSQKVEPRKRSRFISAAIRSSLRGERDKQLAREYQEAAEELRRVNRELEGAISDGLD